MLICLMRRANSAYRGTYRSLLMPPTYPSLSHNRFLARMNTEAKARRSTKSGILRTAKVPSYEDLEKTRAERAAKEATKAVRAAKKVTRERETKMVANVTRQRQRKSHRARIHTVRSGRFLTSESHLRRSQRPRWRG